MAMGGAGGGAIALPPAPVDDPNNLSDDELACKGGVTVTATPARLWRLTDSEWAATIAYAVRGTRPASPTEGLTIPRELEGRPFTYRSSDLFTTFSGGYGMTDGDFEDAAAGASAGAQLIVNAVKAASPCVTTAASADAMRSCLSPLVTARGELLFRRPLAAEEVARYVEIGAANLGKVDGGAEAAARLAFEALLLSPHFLYRTEVGTRSGAADTVRLTPFEIASSLSYALTRRPPDAPLWEAAKNNQLGTSDQIRAQVERLLIARLTRLPDEHYETGRHWDYPALQLLDELFKYDVQPAKGPDVSHPNGFMPDRALFDTRETIKYVFKHNARKDFLKTLLTTRTFVIRNQTQKYWGPSVRSQIRPHPEYNAQFNQTVTFPAHERAGILSSPAFLSAWSAFDHNLPVQRGKFIREALLCLAVPPLPISQVPPLPKADRLRDAINTHSALPCAQACHRLMDPLGLPFEQYDHVGLLRGIGGAHYTKCCNLQGVVDERGPVDMSGELTGAGTMDGPITAGVPELMDKLARSPRVEQCFVRQNFRFWLGRAETKHDACVIDAALSAYRKDGDLVALVSTLLSSPANMLRSAK
jgi:hypothetical protein